MTGDIFEIGCHHGRSTFLLGQMVRPTEKLSVCDLFNDQEANVSGSGEGERDVFMENMRPLTESGLELRIFQGRSQGLTVEEIGADHRFFHVDGGHNPDEARADLELAAQATVNEAVIAVDDPFRQEWPGVTEALIQFLNDHNEFRPAVVGFNKMILVRNEYADLYIPQLVDEEKREAYGFGYPWQLKQLPFLGQPMHILYLYSWQTEESLSSFLEKYYRTRNRTLSTSERLLIRLLIKLLKSVKK
ncbi:class I SAM-dependent methyltransferase [Salinibacter ruber]|uniref:class I SAM-dependent methyltransferase n=1 Tax=Salinibacter ruber TaxID=146919 RepID=UPI00311AABE4